MMKRLSAHSEQTIVAQRRICATAPRRQCSPQIHLERALASRTLRYFFFPSPVNMQDTVCASCNPLIRWA